MGSSRTSRDPFSVHKNNNFQKLLHLLEKEGVISSTSCNDGIGQRTTIEKFQVFSELLYFSMLIHDYGVEKVKDGGLLVSDGRNIGICIHPILSGKILNNLVDSGEEIVASDGLFNSLIAVYIATRLCFKFLYPNTYIVELGKNTHEIDIFGGVLNNNKTKYLMIESTLGFLRKKKEGESGDSHMEHFKKAVFRKWTVEKIFNVDVSLIYISVVDTLPTSELVSKILEVDRKISIVSFLPMSKAYLSLNIFANDYMGNYNMIVNDLLNRIDESLRQVF